jgi:hypothetical protein
MAAPACDVPSPFLLGGARSDDHPRRDPGRRERRQLEQPFSAKDVVQAVRKHHFSRGSIGVTLARYSRRQPNKPDPPLRRIAPGQYRLARTAASAPSRARPGCVAHRSAEVGK